MSGPLKRKAGDIASTSAKKTKGDASITSFFKTTTPSKPKPEDATSHTPGASIASVFTSPASAITASPSTVKPAFPTKKPFNKDEWLEKLGDEQKELLKLEIETLHDSWLPYVADELISKDFLELKRFLKKEIDGGKKVFPPMEDVYSWSRHTPFHTIKAVILGQDPYHNVNQAHGLCFSVRAPTPAPPSLKNIYKCLAIDYPSFKPPPKNSGLLTPWADRGVLLLNTCLTVRAHEANSHAGKGWERFTQKCIDAVSRERKDGVVFLAWGSPAQKRVVGVNGSRHLVLKSVHPSPLSASRGFVS